MKAKQRAHEKRAAIIAAFNEDKTRTYKDISRIAGVSPAYVGEILRHTGLHRYAQKEGGESLSSAARRANCSNRPRSCFECPLSDCIFPAAMGNSEKELEYLRIGREKGDEEI